MSRFEFSGPFGCHKDQSQILAVAVFFQFTPTPQDSSPKPEIVLPVSLFRGAQNSDFYPPNPGRFPKVPLSLSAASFGPKNTLRAKTACSMEH